MVLPSHNTLYIFFLQPKEIEIKPKTDTGLGLGLFIYFFNRHNTLEWVRYKRINSHPFLHQLGPKWV